MAKRREHKRSGKIKVKGYSTDRKGYHVVVKPYMRKRVEHYHRKHKR